MFNDTVELQIPFKVEKVTCPNCDMKFALFAIFEGEDPEYGFQRSWASQIPNPPNKFYCPYCGNNIGKASGD